ncbi:MAG TPA: hypothetical protein VE288_06880 [Rubrobacteraceae bacterium]|nr:hypothetical protein [Rubrobacteraceae bacterium]
MVGFSPEAVARAIGGAGMSGVLPGRLCSFRGGTCVIRAPLAKPVADAECSGERGP